MLKISTEELLKYLLVLFQDTEKRLTKLREELSVVDIKQDEILHYIEIHKLNAVKSCKIVKILKQVREERREIKNEIDAIRSLKDSFLDKYKNKFIEKDIIQAIKNLNELEKRQMNPKYTYQFLTEELELNNENRNTDEIAKP